LLTAREQDPRPENAGDDEDESQHAEDRRVTGDEPRPTDPRGQLDEPRSPTPWQAMPAGAVGEHLGVRGPTGVPSALRARRRPGLCCALEHVAASPQLREGPR
jgi:hypothetical protein